ncbi:hypothetical protein D9X91_05235 [Falsibacillus albus]|uniref:Uncharacterized protein n=2 Tax=Falsibacillus albus TaxID=2478915 RepID=A0A3L7K3C7_9BACI|nr:hypothetical protein D9X91_05235 [Falsibacillus albus]
MYQSFHRDFPQADPKLFMSSAVRMKGLLKDAQLLMDKISQSSSYSKKLMDFAQESKMVEVEKTINSIGMKNKPVVKVNPDGLNLLFVNQDSSQLDCCKLQIALRWN